MARYVTWAVAAALLACGHSRAAVAEPAPEVSYCASKTERRAPYYLKRVGWRNPNPLASPPWTLPRDQGSSASSLSEAPSRREALRDEIRSHNDEARACSALLPADERAAPGKVTLRWNVVADGSVSEVCVVREETTLHDGALLRCMASAVLGWRFESARPSDPERITIVSYPWMLDLSSRRRAKATP